MAPKKAAAVPKGRKSRVQKAPEPLPRSPKDKRPRLVSFADNKSAAKVTKAATKEDEKKNAKELAADIIKFSDAAKAGISAASVKKAEQVKKKPVAASIIQTKSKTEKPAKSPLKQKKPIVEEEEEKEEKEENMENDGDDFGDGMADSADESSEGEDSDAEESDSKVSTKQSQKEKAKPAAAVTDVAVVPKKEGHAKRETGVVYFGRLPDGFYEPQLKAYLKQFGEVIRLRVSRSPRTGHSKHYAFVEFENADVAKIVAETMNNYLMFGHIVQCAVIPQDKVHPRLFVGANRVFTRINHKKLNRNENNKVKPIEERKAAQKKYVKGLLSKQKKLQALGIDYSFKVPALHASSKKDESPASKKKDDSSASSKKDAKPASSKKDAKPASIKKDAKPAISKKAK